MRQKPFQFNSLASAGGGGHGPGADPFADNGCHPLTAAMLSLIPGLGQLYVGEKRKGWIFLDVTAVNIVLLWLMLFVEPLSRALTQIGTNMHFRVNEGVMTALQYAHLGSPASLLILALMSSFVLYAARDAYDRAFGIRRKRIYGDSVMELSEATSGSYIFHFALMISFAILALFFLVPAAPKMQTVEIKFTEQQPVSTPEKVVSKSAATAAAKAHGHKQPDKPIVAARSMASASHAEPAHASAAHAALKEPVKPPSKEPAHSVAKAEQTNTPAPPSPVHVAPRAVSQPAPRPAVSSATSSSSLPTPQPTSAHVLPTPNPLPAPHAVHSGDFALPLLATTPTRISVGAPALQPMSATNRNLLAQMPAPSTFAHTSAGPPGIGQPHQMKPGSDTGTSGFTPGTMGVPRQTGSSSNAPVTLARVSSPAGTKGDTQGAPPPVRAINDNGPIGTWSVTPNVGSKSGPAGSKSHLSKDKVGNDRRNEDGASNENIDSKNAQEPVKVSPDFGPYMADLQRRIKRHWFPKPDQLSRKVTVRFNVSVAGDLSNLQLVRTCGDSLADKAALDAVQNATPFMHLPVHATEPVDVEFTFDYNVFSGRSSR